MLSESTPCRFIDLAPEILLYIFSYLDLPDLACLSRLSPYLGRLASDPALHRIRILVVAPSRVSHSLFGLGPQGLAFRPTVGDLVHRGVMQGPGIERKWRMGLYFYSTHSVKHYEAGLRLQRRYTSIIVSTHLRRRSPGSSALKSLCQSHVLPVESTSLTISRTLLPIMHQLKWSIQRDRLAKVVRDAASVGGTSSADIEGGGGLAAWIEAKGKGIIQDGERVRLALCPSVRKMVGFYEALKQ